MNSMRLFPGRFRWLAAVVVFAVAAPAEEISSPFLRVPRLERAPQLDGRIEPAEWADAAAVTGLALIGADGALAPADLQAQLLFGYDDRFFYVAARVPNPPGWYPLGRMGRDDAAEVLQDDRLEVWLVPDERARAERRGQGYFHVAVNPLGAIVDRWLNSDPVYREWIWSCGGRAAAAVTPERWETELAISLQSVGVGKPDGCSLFAQVALASGEGDGAVRRGWAAAGPHDIARWGELILDPRAPAVRWRSVGAVFDGDLDAQAEVCRLPEGAAVRAQLRLQHADGRVLIEETRELRADASRSVGFYRQASHLAVADLGNRLALSFSLEETPLFRHEIRVDRWTEARRSQHVQPWLVSRSTTPPVPVESPLDHPQTPLAFIVASVQRLRPVEAALNAAQRANDREAVAALARRLTQEAPFHPSGFLILAAIEATAFNPEGALENLERAVELGFNNPQALAAAPELQSLRGQERFEALLRKAAAARGLQIPAEAQPVLVESPTVEVGPGNVALHPQLGLPVALYRFAPEVPRDLAVTTLSGPAGDLLRQWFTDGTAAGNWGDLYDNRDNGHSRLPARLFPQLTHIRYGDLARQAELDSGLATSIVHDGVVIGNASLAITGGPVARSLPRLAHANPQTMALFYLMYRTGKLYVHPAHLDFPREPSDAAALDPTRRDVFFTNAPFPLVSRGSSGTDQPHVQALAATLAALRPDVKMALQENGLLMPALQMLLRRHYGGVNSDEDYLSGRAHPPVFRGSEIGLEAMVRAAHGLTADALPPWAEIRVVEEETLRNGRDFFEAPGRTEEIFTLPACVARIFRGVALKRRWVLSAGNSADAKGRPLAFHWRLLQGDPSRVRIRPLGDRGERAEIEIDWHPPIPAASEPNVMSSRVDVALFAHNGIHFSAPAFFTIYFPASEERTYDEAGRIRRVVYRSGSNAPFVDPMIYTARSWTDEYLYDVSGTLTGWARTIGDRTERYDTEGRRIGADGVAREVPYRLTPDGPLMRLEPTW